MVHIFGAFYLLQNLKLLSEVYVTSRKVIPRSGAAPINLVISQQMQITSFLSQVFY